MICGDVCPAGGRRPGTPAHEDDDDDTDTPVENDDENPALTECPRPGDDGSRSAGGRGRTRA